MQVETVTLQIPEPLYQRLVNTARATGQSIEQVMLHALQVGSPPTYEDVPAEFQTELAALDQLDNNTLLQIANNRKTTAEMERYNILLERNQSNSLTDTEQLELIKLRQEADLFMLRKAQASALLRWRGYNLTLS
ncbi:hypothetical protein [Lyngbya sp. PCC 8106]|uniref:hypothetical protein n=1 Tax=Lyngbya sp. (strain PCC 8106) TaxID=313612 RepID=UPI0000EA9D8C|nr:hypothetical protein [Lyngbya sp. PCC 8106]EAW39005.1 hypothetical protein L8106_01782 [Lyngbya sp. PCC 8106]